jgi:hypothetical protein
MGTRDVVGSKTLIWQIETVLNLSDQIVGVMGLAGDLQIPFSSGEMPSDFGFPLCNIHWHRQVCRGQIVNADSETSGLSF